MEFTNTFTVQAPLQLVWKFMLDANEVAPCVPGAQLTETLDETHYKGTVKVKLGAVQMTYRGELEMQPDEPNRTITLRAKGTETRGSGGASGTFTTQLTEPEEGVTHVEILSKVDVTGRVAQFGRGIMQDVANRLIKEFASCLEKKLEARSAPQEQAGETQAAASTAPAASATAPPSTDLSPQAASSTSNPSALPAPAGSSSPPSASTSGAPPPAPPPPTAPSAPGGNELRVQDLVADIVRSRLAAGLRALASYIEPK